MSTIGENIKKCRIERGMTQKKLSELLNVSQNAVHNWETGKREPNMAILHQIAKILDKSIILLIDGNEEKHPLSADDYKIDLFNSMTDEEKQMLIDRQALMKAIDKAPGAGNTPLEQLTASFAKLTNEGQQKVADYADDLTKIPQYQRHKD